MATGTFRITNIGLLQKQKLWAGLATAACKYVGLSGDTSVVDAATSPAQELTTNGCGRREMTFTDKSVAPDFVIEGRADYEFNGQNTINSIFISWALAPGANMYGMGILSIPQAVDQDDQLTVYYRDHLGRSA